MRNSQIGLDHMPVYSPFEAQVPVCICTSEWRSRLHRSLVLAVSTKKSSCCGSCQHSPLIEDLLSCVWQVLFPVKSSTFSSVLWSFIYFIRAVLFIFSFVVPFSSEFTVRRSCPGLKCGGHLHCLFLFLWHLLCHPLGI